MKKLFIILIFLLVCGNIFTQNFSFNGDYDPDLYSTIHYFTINDDKITYKYEHKQLNEEITVGYKKIYKDGLLFLEMAKKFPHSIASYYENAPTSNTLLVLAGKHVSEDGSKKLFPNGPILFFAETAGFEQYNYCFITPHINFYDHVGRIYYDCSSYLKEKNREYKVDDLDNCKPGTPWVEGVPGPGIGEGFTNDNTGHQYLLIMNGYISYDKPYLYKQNNRVKKLKVTGIRSGKSIIVDVLDTPHPQTVDISAIVEDFSDVRVEIADVYKGTKYDDTCMNFCITYSYKVIPYKNSIDGFLPPDNFDK